MITVSHLEAPLNQHHSPKISGRERERERDRERERKRGERGGRERERILNTLRE